MLKERLENKEKMVGMYVFMGGVGISRISALAGYDLLWLDSEHSYMSYESILRDIMAIRTTDTPVIVRVPQNDLSATKKVLEMGVDGIIFPMIRSREEAEAAVKMVMYPPEGERGFGPMNAMNYGYMGMKEYLEESKKICKFIQIEHRDAIECLDEIMEIEAIDGYIFGPNDLSGSYGMLGDVFSDKITEVIKSAIAKLRSKGKYVAIASGGFTEEIIAHWSSFDPDMIIAGADFDFLRDGAVRNRKNLEKMFKKI